MLARLGYRVQGTLAAAGSDLVITERAHDPEARSSRLGLGSAA
ncbi:MAG: hypothetical protein ACRDPM_10080 [Solirubrobacteraceae bacterium]